MAKTFKYPCIRSKQRADINAPEFLVFAAPAGEIDEWASIERYTPDSKSGPQRLSKPAKIADVKRFFDRDERNTIPTSLLITLKVQTGWLSQVSDGLWVLEFTLDLPLNETDKPGMIIDGQHRLMGVLEFDRCTPLNVVALMNASDDETAFQFLVVNNKASKVPNSHLKALALHYREDALDDRLREVRMSISQHLDFVGFADQEPQSPFKGKIEWPNNPEDQGFIAANAIESAIAYLKQKRVPEFEDDGILLGFFFAIWTPISIKFARYFNKDSNLLKKVSIVVLTEVLADNLIVEYDNQRLDLTDYEKVAKEVERIIETINPKFWESKWTAKSLDTSTGRSLLRDSLIKVRRNFNADRPWYEDVAIIDPQTDLL
jgi:DGQHR domain-containing protein